jgi:hypothetical protein
MDLNWLGKPTGPGYYLQRHTHTPGTLGVRYHVGGTTTRNFGAMVMNYLP